MVKSSTSVKMVMDTIVPITRFNRGEANKIFDEVKERGFKLVLKNNAPACVLLEPERYEAMTEALEDYALFFEAETRRKNAEENGYLSSDQIMSTLGISESELVNKEGEVS